MNFISTRRRFWFTALSALVFSALLACKGADRPFTFSAIPDQDPEKMNRLYGKVAAHLEKELGTKVVYKGVTDYTAAVTGFKLGDIDLVWFGGLTGVQARLQAPGSEALIQRDIDTNFHSVFIANKKSGIKSFSTVKGLTALKGHSFTFGSESSTSGRLMPQYFLSQAGVKLTDLKGESGFSGSHDKTIKLVEAGSFDAGVLNEQVWKSRLKKGEVDTSKVAVLFSTPAYFDYHWVLGPKVSKKRGAEFVARLKAAFVKLDPANAEDKEILSLFGAKKFIPTANENYSQIEAIGREIGKIK